MSSRSRDNSQGKPNQFIIFGVDLHYRLGIQILYMHLNRQAGGEGAFAIDLFLARGYKIIMKFLMQLTGARNVGNDEETEMDQIIFYLRAFGAKVFGHGKSGDVIGGRGHNDLFRDHPIVFCCFFSCHLSTR